MEQQVNTVVNFGIGCYRAITEQFNDISHRLQENVQELVARGEKAGDKTSLKIREMAGRATDLLSRGEKTKRASRAA